MNRLREYLNGITTASPKGDPLVDPPWLKKFDNLGLPLWDGHNPTRWPLREYYLIVCWGCVLIGLLPWVRGFFAIGLTGLLLSHLLRRRIWKGLGSLECEVVGVPKTIGYGETLQVTVQISNQGKRKLDRASVHLYFGGSGSGSALRHVLSLLPGTSKQVVFSYKCDKGLGPYEIGPLHTTVSDSFGAILLTTEQQISQTVIVTPKVTAVSFLEAVTANRPILPGGNELPMPGSSPAFLGIRTWQQGDSIRQIDWKRSMRRDDLVVKEFERTSATDVAIFMDGYACWHSEFATTSTHHTMRTIALSVSRTLTRQGAYLSFFHPSFTLRKQDASFESITDAVVSSSFSYQTTIGNVIRESVHEIAPSTMIVLIVNSSSLLDASLAEQLLILKDKRCDIILIEIQDMEYAAIVATEARLKERAMRYADYRPETGSSRREEKAQVRAFCSRYVLVSPTDDLTTLFQRVA